MIRILTYSVLVRTYLVLSLSHQWFAYRLFPTQNDHQIIAQVILQLPLHIPMPLLYGLVNVLPAAFYLDVSTDTSIPFLSWNPGALITCVIHLRNSICCWYLSFIILSVCVDIYLLSFIILSLICIKMPNIISICK